MFKDTSIIKEKIIDFLEKNGPSLPVHISKHIKVDMLFTSAFLSELLNQGRIKHSHMRVGTSAIYFLPGKKQGLEKFSEYLKSKEKEAYNLLLQKKFLIDSEQETAIKVALKEIKDFAIPFEKDSKLVWRYFLNSEEEYSPEKEKTIQNKGEIVESKTDQRKKQNKEETEKKEKPKKVIKKKTATKKSNSEKKNEQFFSTIKEDLIKKGFEISDILSFSKKDLILKVKKDEKEKLLVAFNKKRITETDIINAYNKAKEENLEYIILSLGEPAKKTQQIIEASKLLSFIETIKL